MIPIPITSVRWPTMKSKTVKRAEPGSRRRRTEAWRLRLYVAGQTPRSVAAFSNLTKICEGHLNGRYSIEVIDLVEQPNLAKGDQILAIPTLVRRLPQPMRKIIGDLSDTERVLVGLDLRAAETAVSARGKPNPSGKKR